MEALSRLAFRSKAHWGYPREWLEAWRPELTLTPATLREQRVFVARRHGFRVLQIDSDPHAEGFYLRMGAVRHSTVPAPVAGVERELPRLRVELVRER